MEIDRADVASDGRTAFETSSDAIAPLFTIARGGADGADACCGKPEARPVVGSEIAVADEGSRIDGARATAVGVAGAAVACGIGSARTGEMGRASPLFRRPFRARANPRAGPATSGSTSSATMRSVLPLSETVDAAATGGVAIRGDAITVS